MKGFVSWDLGCWMFMRVKRSSLLLVMNAAARLQTPDGRLRLLPPTLTCRLTFESHATCDIIDIYHCLHIQPSRCLSDGNYIRMYCQYDPALTICAACPSRRTTTSRTAPLPLSTVPASLTSRRTSWLDWLFSDLLVEFVCGL
jgi:hypothetical protein